MIKEQVIAQLQIQMQQACPQCTQKVFTLLMDPQTQGLVAPLIKERHGLLQFHVHKAGITDPKGAEDVVLFLMVVYITEEKPILSFTPSSSTIEGAFENLRETINRESARLQRQRLREDATASVA